MFFVERDLRYNFFCVLQVLVGESIVKQKDPTEGIRQLFGKDISG